MNNKPTDTSAPTTEYCFAKVEGPDGRALYIDGNGKITSKNGTLLHPKPNAFSLIQISDCPGSTEACRKACYVHGIEKHAQETYKLYKHNSEQMHALVDSNPRLLDAWATTMAKWINTNAEGGFRWHVSGDVFSLNYAAWIAKVCSRSLGVNHWIYTRSFDFLTPLLNVRKQVDGNLAINLSCDKDNYEAAKVMADKHRLRLCYLTLSGVVPDDLPDGSVIFPDYSLRGGNELGQKWFEGLTPQYKSFVCPVDYHGKSENRRCGPCDRCLI